jgi:hypothetical protein
MYGYLTWLVGSAALWLIVIAILRRTARSDYQRGRQAKRDGLPLNVRWSPKVREGWADQWHVDARNRARQDLRRKLNMETDR